MASQDNDVVIPWVAFRVTENNSNYLIKVSLDSTLVEMKNMLVMTGEDLSDDLRSADSFLLPETSLLAINNSSPVTMQVRLYQGEGFSSPDYKSYIEF